MGQAKEVKVCPTCSKFDKEDLTKKLEGLGHKVKFGCIVYCRDREETKYPYFGLIDGKLEECVSKEEFFQRVME